jgi:RimJ/RimL family protein N-acetyltransferase
MSWAERVEIRTSRLILRSARADDLEAMHAVLSDPRATVWWSTPPHETLDQTRAWLDDMIANGPDHPDFVVELDGRVIGKAGFYVLPDVGYILHPDVWGQGLASEAVGAVIDHVFRTLDLDTLTADVDPENAASIRLLERLGFVRTGFAERTWNVGGVWKDSIYYALSGADRSASAAGQAPA